LTMKRHFTMALWLPVRPPATTLASLNRWSSHEKRCQCGARSSVGGWDTMLQARRSWVGFPMRSLDLSNDINLPAALWP
jgi:hypothetical protein